MSTSTRKPTWLNRRNFLKLAGISAVAAGGTAGLLRARAKKTPVASQDRKNDAPGYRETDHIRLYYSLARL